jgi:hypothetical protein
MTKSIPDVVLERYRLKELPDRTARALEQMMAADPAIRERLEALAQSDAEIQRQYPGAAFVPSLPAAPRRLLPFALVATLGAAAAALALAIAVPRIPAPAPETAPETDRVKGTVNNRPALAIYRRTAAGSERLADGDIVHPGDLVRVGYASGGRPFGLILSIDGRGAVTLHLPPAGDRAVSLSAGKTVLLEAAYELDDAPRIERFYFVTGAQPFAAAPVLSAARRAVAQGTDAPQALPLPAGLEQVTFAIQKEERK